MIKFTAYTETIYLKFISREAERTAEVRTVKQYVLYTNTLSATHIQCCSGDKPCFLDSLVSSVTKPVIYGAKCLQPCAVQMSHNNGLIKAENPLSPF